MQLKLGLHAIQTRCKIVNPRHVWHPTDRRRRRYASEARAAPCAQSA
jgi:hypothetical protein